MIWTQPFEGDVGPEQDKDKPPELPAPPPPPRRAQFGLRHIMLLSVLVAVVIAAVSSAIRSRRESDLIIAVATVAASLVVVGLFLTKRFIRWTFLGWILTFLGLTVMTAVTTGGLTLFQSGMALSLGWLTILATLLPTLFIMAVVIASSILLILRRRSAEQDAMLWVLALAAERNRPLGPAVTALARQSRGIYRSRAQRLAECLDHGMPLPDSLDFVTHAVSAPARVLIRVGHDSGALAEALHDAAKSRSTRPPGWESFGAKVGYLCMILAVLQSITGFILYFITPKFEVIFKDFGVDLPPITKGMIFASHWITYSYIFPIFLASELLFLIYVPLALSGYGSLQVPLIDRIFLRRHSVLIFRCLAMIVEGEKPIGVGLQILARWYPTTWVRERLAGAYLATNQGVDWIAALHRFRLASRSDVALLDAARRLGNLPWAFRELAEGSARKLGDRMQVVNQVLLSLVLIAVGAVVGLFAAAYFLPLVVLIERLAG